jgi:asparagine synthase (glutamine-hydrolysing)
VCGISGIITTGQARGLEQSLIAMQHRGPDADGTWCGVVGKYNVGLGHLRLSIVDLSPSSNQPFSSADGLRILIFNGEIYNYRALREELRAIGHRFITESDTEVLLTAYTEWGIECLRRFDGMFAFAMLDRQQRQLYLARDPLGIKPLYVWTDNQSRIAFASEIRGLRPLANQAIEPDPATFAEFLLNGWLYEPNTGFRGVHKIMPGEFRRIDLDSGTMQSTIYYDPLSRPAPKSSFDELLADSVGLQRLADVNVGLFYSGGLDSSVLASASDNLEGLFVDYSGETGVNDDAIYAKPIADRLGLQFRTIRHDAATADPESIIADFQHVARGTEELISDYTYTASDLLSHNAHAAGYKVMLSGMGGDELFAGYPRYILARYRRIVRSFLPALRLAASALHKYPSMEKKMERLLRFSADGRFIRAYTSLIGYFSEQEVSRLLGTADACEPFWGWTETMGKKVKHLSPLKQAMYLDRFGFLPHNLMVTDKSSMANSIEMRVPLMSNALAELGFSLPDRRLLDYGGGKIPLRSLLRKRLPDGMVNRPKAGFNPPLDGKIAVLGYARIADILKRGPISHIVDGDFSCGIVRAHFSGMGNQTYKIWQLLYFNFWLEAATLAVTRPGRVSDQA